MVKNTPNNGPRAASQLILDPFQVQLKIETGSQSTVSIFSVGIKKLFFTRQI